eukprot:5515134-Pleurochrysis_carterae.AAC.1
MTRLEGKGRQCKWVVNNGTHSNDGVTYRCLTGIYTWGKGACRKDKTNHIVGRHAQPLQARRRPVLRYSTQRRWLNVRRRSGARSSHFQGGASAV